MKNIVKSGGSFGANKIDQLTKSVDINNVTFCTEWPLFSVSENIDRKYKNVYA